MRVHVERTYTNNKNFNELVSVLPADAVRAVVLDTRDGMTVETVRVNSQFSHPAIGEYIGRTSTRDREFVAVLCIPTGIGCEIGGHAGDAGATARLLGSVVDTLVLHPNVVNAADINEMPENGLYVEGAALTQLMMGTLGLVRRRKNRIGLVIEEHPCEEITAWTHNSANAARMCYGADIEIFTCPPMELYTRQAADGLPEVMVGDLSVVDDLMRTNFRKIDAWAIASRVEMPEELMHSYLAGDVDVNPWGLAEATLTHTLGLHHAKPVAHAPMVSAKEELDIVTGVVDPRIAAETVSTTYINCVLKGLTKAPKLVSSYDHGQADVTVRDIDALVIPRGVLGLPVWAALEQKVPVIEVMGNRNKMQNDLTDYKWDRGMHYQVRSYAEAAGVLAALRAGIDPATTWR